MAHPLLEEFCRSTGQLRPEFFRRCQRVFREEVIPTLNETEGLRAENDELKAKLEALQQKAAARRKDAAVPA